MYMARLWLSAVGSLPRYAQNENHEARIEVQISLAYQRNHQPETLIRTLGANSHALLPSASV